MPHVLSMFDSSYLYAFDLQGRDVTVKIARVTAGTLVGQGGRTSRKPVVYFIGKERGLALNKTNARTIIALYGPHTEDWVGKWVTLFPTTTMMGSEPKDCIRIRPTAPKPKDQKSEPDPVIDAEAAEILAAEHGTVQ